MCVCVTMCVFVHVWEEFSDSVKLTRAEEDQYGEEPTSYWLLLH